MRLLWVRDEEKIPVPPIRGIGNEPPVKLGRRAFLGGILATGAAGALGCTPGLLKKRSNLVLITADTVRAQSMSCYGHPRLTSPCADLAASRGVLFENAYSTSICTMPGHASIFTGLFPDRHGVITNYRRLKRNIPTLAEILSREGYTTAAFLGIWILNEPEGIARGFQYIDWSETDRPSPLNAMRRSGDYIDQVIAFLKQMKRRKEPFFLWVHSFDAHAPYMPPEPFGSMYVNPDLPTVDIFLLMQGLLENLNGYRPEFPRPYMESQYLGEIRYWDSNFQKIFEVMHESGNLADTFLIYTSDHGENIGENGIYGHVDLNQPVIRIPLIAWHPDRLPAKSVRTPVQQTDLVPTILNLLKIEYKPDDFEGMDLMPLILGRHPEDLHRPVFVINSGYSSASIIDTSSNLKIIKKPLIDFPYPDEDMISKQSHAGEFIDSIQKNRFRWRIVKKKNLLSFSFSGEIKMDRPVTRVMIMIVRRNPAGNLSVDMISMIPRESAFSFSYEFPRYQVPHPVSDSIPCDYVSMIPTSSVKYSLWMFESSGDAAYVSSWFQCLVTDENGTVLHLKPGSLDRMIRLSSDEDQQWGHQYDPGRDPNDLMARLNRFLNRRRDMTYRIDQPESGIGDLLILPASEEFETATPREIYDKYLEILSLAPNKDVFEKNRQQLESLGYIS